MTDPDIRQLRITAAHHDLALARLRLSAARDEVAAATIRLQIAELEAGADDPPSVTDDPICQRPACRHLASSHTDGHPSGRRPCACDQCDDFITEAAQDVTDTPYTDGWAGIPPARISDSAYMAEYKRGRRNRRLHDAGPAAFASDPPRLVRDADGRLVRINADD